MQAEKEDNKQSKRYISRESGPEGAQRVRKTKQGEGLG